MKGEVVPAGIFSLTIHEWLPSAPGILERGDWVRDVIGPLALSDAAIRAIGLAAEMLLGGQADKAVIMYNRFASMADAEPMQLISLRPLAIYLCGATVIVRDSGEMYRAAA